MSESKKPTIEEIVRCKDLSYLYATLEMTEEQKKEFNFLDRKIRPFDRIAIMCDEIKKRGAVIADLLATLKEIRGGHDLRCSYTDNGCVQCMAIEAIAKAKRELE